MGKRFYAMTLTVMMGIISLGGCRQSSPTTPTSDKLQVMVSIAPQKYFVEKIGNGYVNVDVMVPAGAEPHTFEPKPQQLKALSRAELYLRIRIDFEEAWMDKIKTANPKMQIVDTTQGIQRLPMSTERGTGDTGNVDPHIWLSPSLVKTQARTIYTALTQRDPQHQAIYQANLDRFLTDINLLDRDIRRSLQGVKNRKFIVFHPSWGYFARDYDLTMIPIEAGGQEPSAAELAQLIREAKRDSIKVVFAEPQFSQQTADTISKQIGGEVLLIDPLAPDWLNNLRQVSKTFSKVLSQDRILHPAILSS